MFTSNANHIPALKHLTLLSLVGRRHEAELLVSCDNSSFPSTDEDFNRPENENEIQIHVFNSKKLLFAMLKYFVSYICNGDE